MFIFVVDMKPKLLILFLMVSFTAMAYNDHRNAKVDSLEALLKSKHPPTGDDLLRAYDELMRGWLPIDGQKASYYGKKALALSYERNGLRIRQNVLRLFAQMYYAREDFDEAIRLFSQALAVVDTMKHDSRYTQKDIDDARSCIYGAIGNVYNLQDKHHLAIHYYQMALPIFEKYNWLESQAVLFHNIGELYYTMGNEQEAEQNYLKAIEKGTAARDSLMIAMGRKGLLRLYVGQDDYSKALRVAEPCFAYYRAHKAEEVEDYPVVLASLTRLHLMKGYQDIAAAKKYAEEALLLVDSLVFEHQSDIFAACSELAMAEHQWEKALFYAQRTIHPDSLATSADASCYRLLAEIYMQLGQKDKARLYINKMYELMSRYSTDHYQSGLSQMEVLYETEKKEAQIASLGKERTLYRWLLLAASIAIAAFVAGGILMVIVQRRKKALLAANVALETETRERRILAQDLHDGIGGMLSLLRLKMEDYKRQIGQQGQQEEVLPMIDNIHTELRRTAHHLMPEELLKNGLESALRDFAVSVPGAQFQAIGNIQLPKDKELVLYRCAYELVNNVLKHTNANRIDIQLMQDASEVMLTVSDNGQGIPLTPDASSVAADSGMGLRNIRERISSCHGRVDIASVVGKGTDINVILPL